MAKPMEHWGTRVGVILAVAGSAVGLGNFLRFPGQAAENSGGTFMIPYFISLVLLGIPICWAEWTLGRYGGARGSNSAPGVFAAVSKRPRASYLGALGVMVPVIIYMYYVLIEAWCLRYAWGYLTGTIDLGATTTEQVDGAGALFASVTGVGEDGSAFSDNIAALLIFLFVFALNFTLIYRGVTRGIEKFCIYVMPLMSLLAVVVLFRVLTLGTPDPALPDQNVVNGLAFMWNPDWRALGNANTWLAASGQIFFTLSVGFGIIVNYASYLRRNDDVALSGLTSASTNQFFEVCLGGLITIPAAFIFLGATALAAQSSTFGLGFTALPIVFENMPLGRLFGFAWFFMLFLAAITSSLSMLQPAIAFLEEALGIGRRASVSLLGIITLMGALFVLYFSGGLSALDTMDFWVGTFLLFVLATIEVILFSWILGVDKGYKELMRGAEISVPRRLFTFVIKYITPVYLLVIFTAWTWQNILRPDEDGAGRVQQLLQGGVPLFSVLVILVVLGGIVGIVAATKEKWVAAANAPDPVDDNGEGARA